MKQNYKKAKTFLLNNYKLVLLLVLIFALLRLLFLDADPGLFKRIGDIGDEGYWAYGARNLNLYGQLIIDDFTQASATAPFYTLLSFIAFKIGGVSLYAARLVPAVFSIFTIILLYFFLKNFDKNVALLGSLFLAINYNYFIYSRIGHVETVVSFFLLLTFWFLETRKSWFGGGISYALAVTAKITTVWFFPAIILYAAFRYLRDLTGKKLWHKILHFLSGSLAIGIPFLIYEIVFWDEFRPTLEALSGGLNLLGAPARLVRAFASGYFINPINIFLVLILFLWLREVEILKIFSNKAKEYLQKLNSLEIIVLSWIFGYLPILVVFQVGNRRFQLFTVILSIIPAILLKNRKLKKAHLFRSDNNPNKIQKFFLLLPLILGAAFVGGRILPITYALYISGFVALLSVLFIIFLSSNEYIGHKTMTILKILSFFSFLGLISAKFIFHLPNIFPLEINYVNVFAMGFLTIIVLLLFVYTALTHKDLAISLVCLISVALLLFSLSTPSFTVRNASKTLGKYTDKTDYVIGALGHMLSLNAQFHPVWWIPNKPRYEELNKEFVKKIKPKYLLQTEEWKNRGPLESWPRKKNLDEIGATKSQKLCTFGLYPSPKGKRALFSFWKLEY